MPIGVNTALRPRGHPSLHAVGALARRRAAARIGVTMFLWCHNQRYQTAAAAGVLSVQHQERHLALGGAGTALLLRGPPSKSAVLAQETKSALVQIGASTALVPLGQIFQSVVAVMVLVSSVNAFGRSCQGMNSWDQLWHSV